jgi:serine/threonine protein phosphatase PrpC
MISWAGGGSLKHSWGYASDQRLRDENQDSHGVFEFEDFTLALVCDGMGGHVGGAEASAIAVRTIWEAMTDLHGRPVGAALQKAILKANEAIYNASRKHRRYMGMGTTVVAVALEGNVAHIAHVGDSRLYAIRDRMAHLLTRDHTMVNLFVEAELLSPEDAAAHPEAHVLARSLGVEPTVEVDLQDPLELESGDLLVMCSDGVHGPLEDEQIGGVDWDDLPRGCEQVIQLIRDDEGDDNATLVVIGLDIAGSPEVPPTPPPELVDLDRKEQEAEEEDEAAAARRERNEPKPPMLYDEAQVQEAEAEGAGAAAAMAADLEPVEVELEVQPLEEELVLVEGEVAPADGAAATVATVLAEAQRRTSQRVVMIGAALLLLLVIGAVFMASRQYQGDRTLPEGESPDEVEVTFLTPEPIDVAPEPEPIEGVSTDTEAVEPVVAEVVEPSAPPVEGDFYFDPDLPDLKRRYSHRASRSWGPPPPGPRQLLIAQSVKDGHCAAALVATMRAMGDSVDYGDMYKEVWLCFDVAHHQPLSTARAETPEDFGALLPHFEGTTEPSSVWPRWYLPATDGLEFRLDKFLSSDEVDQFAEAMLDQHGPERLADELLRDLLLEAQAAVALSRLEDPTPPQVQWWARRVYTIAGAMKALPGDLIRQHNPEGAELTEGLLDEATGGAYSDPTRSAPSRVVQEALEVGRGDLEQPRRARPLVVAAPPPPEPEPEPEPEPTSDDVKIHRTGPQESPEEGPAPEETPAPMEDPAPTEGPAPSAPEPG